MHLWLGFSNSALSDVNLHSASDDYNDYSPENQNESDTEFICEEAEQHWDVSSEDILRDFNEESSSETINPVQPNNSIMKLISTFLLLWASFYGISATALNHLIKFLHYTLSLLSSNSPTIASVCVTCTMKVNDEVVIAVNPIRKKIFL